MKHICIGLAGRVIDIGVRYHSTYELCQSFITKGKPDFCVSCTEEDLEQERQLAISHGRNQSLSFYHCEPTAMLRKLATSFLDHEVLMLHGAAVALAEEVCIFVGPSGIGKTTHAMKWLENRPDSYIINGDKPFIRTYENSQPALVCGSPWSGKEGDFVNETLPLKAIVIMERSDSNSMCETSLFDEFPAIWEQTYRPNDSVKTRQALVLLRRLQNSTRFFHFRFNNYSTDCFKVSYEAIYGQI